MSNRVARALYEENKNLDCFLAQPICPNILDYYMQMLKDPLVRLFIPALVSVTLGWLINQLPPIREFPGRGALTIRLTLEVLILGVIGQWLIDSSQLSESIQNITALFSIIVFLFLTLDIWQLFEVAWKGQTSLVEEQQIVRNRVLRIIQTEVAQRLKDSLHNQVIIDVLTEEQPEQIGRTRSSTLAPDLQSHNWLLRFGKLLRINGKTPIQVDSSKSILEIFRQDDINGKLLILGGPGSGKTTLLLTLAQDLIEQALIDDSQPIPIILELSSWDSKQAFLDWIVNRLKVDFKIPSTVSRSWLGTGRLIPLFDGLDELGLARHIECVQAINQFLSSSEICAIVCCRLEEYEEGKTKLNALNGAICLQALTAQQIQNYLRQLDRPQIWGQMRSNPELLELAKIPLLLTIMVMAYQGQTIKSSQELFNAYIEKRFKSQTSKQSYSASSQFNQEITKHYLIWLAKKLKNISQTEFLIETIQPDWLQDNKYIVTYRFITGFISGFICWFLVWRGNEDIFGFTLWGLIAAGYFGSRKSIEPFETFEISIESARRLWHDLSTKPKIILKGFVFPQIPLALIMSIFMFLYMYISGRVTGSINYILFYGTTIVLMLPILLIGMGAFYSIIISLIFGMGTAFKGPNLRTHERRNPNEGIRQSFWNALRFALVGGLAWGSFLTLAGWVVSRMSNQPMNWLDWLTQGLSLGLIVGLFSGVACIQHLVLRLLLWQRGFIPWNYARFLNYAVKLRLMQQIGGRYRFIHDLMREHFAEMPID